MADIKNFNIVGIASGVQMGSRGGRLKYDSENGRFDFVQSNNTTLEDVRFGTVESGAWQADIIASQFGGTGMDASTSTGILQFVGGVASVTTVSLSNTSYVTGILSVENGGTGSNTGGLTTSANISAAFFIGNGSQLTGIVGSGAVDSVNGFTGAVTLDTDDIGEGNANLYYSNARVNAFIQSSITTTDIDEGTNLYYTTTRANTAIDNRIVTAVESANVKLKRFSETVVALGNVSGDISSNINLNLGTIFTMTATGNITVNSMANAVPGVSATLIITQDGTGNRLLTSNWKYADAANVLSNAANTTDIVSALFAGNVYYATLSKGYA